MNVDFQTIYGVQFGFEFADNEVLEESGLRWGVSIELGIFRIILSGF